MRIFITGASGYIGGSVAVALAQQGYKVAGLTRGKEKARQLETLGIEAVIGDLDDVTLLAAQARQADVVINAADSDSRSAVESMLPALHQSNKLFIQNSGSSIVSERGCGQRSEKIVDDETMKFDPVPEKKGRVEIDRQVLDASKHGVVSVVICPCLIYGEGLGLAKESQQIPMHIQQAIKSGIARCSGAGENIWSTVHIKDLVALYSLVVKNPPAAGTFLFAENGEITFREIAEQIRKALHLVPEVEEWPIAEAAKEWGEGATVFALASNSRVRAKRARALGWTPKYNCVLDDVSRSCSALTAGVV